MLKYSTLLYIMFLPAIFFSQNSKLIRAGKYYENILYNESIKKLESLDDKTGEVIRKLAENYALTGNFSKSEKYYAELMKTNIKNSDDIYNYASVLAINKKYDEYDKRMIEFCKFNKEDSRAIAYLKNLGFYYDLLLDKEQFKINNLDVNSDYQDFATVYYNDDVVFVSARNENKFFKRIFNFKKSPFIELYSAGLEQSNLINVKPFSRSVYKKYSAGPLSFNEKADFSVLTRNYFNGKIKDGDYRVQLFFSEFIDGKWNEPVPFPYNSTEYSVAHPSLTASGDTLFFASDMTGGFGGVDLYVSVRDLNGDWSKPNNLGNTINTEGNEMFPFIQENGFFFFASDGLLGIGGLDIFYTKFKTDHFLTPKNIGSPVNSNKDDFAFIINDKMKRGFFSSNRDKSQGEDDIWSFSLLKELTFDVVLKGKTIDNNGNILSNTIISLYDKDGNILKAVSSNDAGNYEFIIKPQSFYELEAAKPKFVTKIETVESDNNELIISKDLILEKIPDYVLICDVTDEKTGEPIPDVNVFYTNNKTDIPTGVITYDDGNFFVGLDDYKIRDSLYFAFKLEKEGYAYKTVNFKEVLNRTGEFYFHIKMHKIEIGEDLGKILNINPIYFDYDKWNIRPDAALELDKIVKAMNEHPEMQIELSSHSDCRGASIYNFKLSDKRAKASADYIKSRIKNPNRISGEGYGETKLINDCGCEGGVGKGLDCTEEQHQQNRRTEFRIMNK